MNRFLAVVLTAICLATGWQLVRLADPREGPYPAACADFGFSVRRCAAIVDRARREAGVVGSHLTGVDLVRPPSSGSVRLGGQMVAIVRFTAGDVQFAQEVWCVGVTSEDNLACTDDPQLIVAGGVDHDVPCSGEDPGGDPNGCATLPPIPPAAAIAAATPLHLDALDIPLDHMGMYEVKVGQATLPNGYLTERKFRLADVRPTTFWITDGIRLDVRSRVAGRPPVGTIYRDGFKGSEPVDVFLVFRVTETSPGAVLQVRDLVVQ